jgi:hypothetical protein
MWRSILWMVAALPLSLYLVFRMSLSVIGMLDNAWWPIWLGDGARYAEVVAILPGPPLHPFLAEIIPLSEVNTFVREHPDCTFLIPPGHEQEISVQLENNVAWVRLEVKDRLEGRQMITFEDMNRADDSLGTQYEATRTEVRVKYVHFVGDREIMGAVLNAGLLTALIHIVALSYLTIRRFHGYGVPRSSGS